MAMRANSTGALSRVLIRYLILSASLILILTGCNLPSNEIAAVSTPEISGTPIVQFASPLPNTTYLRDVTINILLRVLNAGEDIDRVELSVDGVVIATIPQPNPSGNREFSVAQTFTPENSGRVEISAVAYRADATSSAPVTVAVTVIDELPQAAADTLEPSPTVQASPTQQVQTSPTATQTLAPTQAQSSPTQAVQVSSTPSAPIVSSQGVNVRRGPSTNFIPPIGVLGPQTTARALALNTAGDWIKIEFNGGEGWVFRDLTEVEGDLSTLPREVGPPIPTLPPPTNTSVPAATNTPVVSSNGSNLTITGFELSPRDPFCQQAALARVNIANTGNAATGAGSRVVFISVDSADGQSDFLSASANIPSLDPGANFLVEIPYTDSSGGGKIKRAVAVVDPDSVIAETNENDNTSQPIDYALGVPPDC